MPKIRIRALVSGRVTGVFFRATTRQVAKKLNLTGYVRNTTDDKVEVIAEGDSENIDKLIEYLHKGPITAKVNDVKIRKRVYTGEFPEFEIKD